jgi:AcrR family transcriptional regulator
MAASEHGRARRAEPGRGGILLTAIDCFARYGYAGTTIDRIARAAGVTKGALYYHWKDKEQLLFEAVTERIEAFEKFVLEQIEREGGPAERLRAVTRMCAENAIADNHRRFILTLMVEAIDTNATLSQQFQEMLRRFRGFHRHLIRQGQEAGLFRTDIDLARAAETFVAGILGAEVQFYQDPESTDLRQSCDMHADQFLAWISV